MATAVNKGMETASPSNPQQRLLIASAIGAAYVAVGMAAVLFGLPYLWRMGAGEIVAKYLNSFVSYACLGALLLGAIVGLVLLGLRLSVTLGGGSPPEGLRSGVFIFAAGGLLLFLISLAAGQLLERYILKSADSRTIGLGLTLAIGVGLLVAAVRYMLKPKFYELLMKFDSQGWFRARFYKPNQGLWVRRLTILGLLAILGTGIWHFVPASGAISTAAIQALKIRVPFLYFEGKAAFAHLLPNAAILGPIIMAVAAFWLSWRAVNFPMFADFLIASEAEMNKVSWTSRKRLIQDTIVVLTTVVLFTFFLLAIDQVWGWVLSRDIIKIVPKARSGEAAKVENVEQDY